MAISYHPGRNLLDDDAEALVNTVNCVGVMGKGIALAFKQAFPDNFERYADACRTNAVYPGRPFIIANRSLVGPKWIINAPTKDHWRDGSQMPWIIQNLIGIKEFIVIRRVRSIAIPPMGCGNGGLLWREANWHFEKILGPLEEVDIRIYAERDLVDDEAGILP